MQLISYKLFPLPYSLVFVNFCKQKSIIFQKLINANIDENYFTKSMENKKQNKINFYILIKHDNQMDSIDCNN